MCSSCSLGAWMREISGLIYNATEEQVVRARNQLKASILFQQDGPGGLSPLPFPPLLTKPNLERMLCISASAPF